MKKSTVLGLALISSIAAGSANAKGTNPLFSADVTPTTPAENKLVVAKGAMADLYGYYGSYYATYALNYGTYAQYSGSSSYYYYAYNYAYYSYEYYAAAYGYALKGQ